MIRFIWTLSALLALVSFAGEAFAKVDSGEKQEQITSPEDDPISGKGKGEKSDGKEDEESVRRDMEFAGFSPKGEVNTGTYQEKYLQMANSYPTITPDDGDNDGIMDLMPNQAPLMVGTCENGICLQSGE